MLLNSLPRSVITDTALRYLKFILGVKVHGHAEYIVNAPGIASFH